MKRLIPLFVLALTATANAQDISMSGGYSTPNSTGITGLWNSTGTTQLTSAVNFTGASFSLSYRTNTALTSPYLTTYKSAYSNVWPLTITVTFSNANWTSYPSATIALNIGNYIETKNNSTGVYSVANLPIDYFHVPSSGAFYASSSTSGFSASTSYTTVNPRTFTLSQFTPTYTGSSSGTLTLNVVEGGSPTGSGYPWDDTPSSTIVGNSGSTTTSFLGILWIFPRVGQAGYHNYFGTFQSAYPIGAP